MVSRGNFDQLIKQEQKRTVGSQRNADGGENARDRVARRLNVQSGKNPNPRTSTAYKPDSGASAVQTRSKLKSTGGKSDGGRSSPRSRDPSLPASAPVPTASPGQEALPTVQPTDPLMQLLPLVIGSMLARKGLSAGAGTPGTPGPGGNTAAMGDEFPSGPWTPPNRLAGAALVPTQSTQSVPM